MSNLSRWLSTMTARTTMKITFTESGVPAEQVIVGPATLSLLKPKQSEFDGNTLLPSIRETDPAHSRGRYAGDVAKAFEEQHKKEAPPEVVALWNSYVFANV